MLTAYAYTSDESPPSYTAFFMPHESHETFDFPDADVVLRSISSEYRIHRCILAVSSPFFKDMFSLPPSPSANNETEMLSLDVSESAATLEALLRFIYPIPDPEIDSLDELTLVLAAASKYDMVAVIESLRKVLVAPRFLAETPTRVFAIASRFDLEEEAGIASRYTLGVNVLDCPLHEDLKHITAYAYHRLLELHRRRAEAAQTQLQLSQNVKCMRCNAQQHELFLPPKWWLVFQERVREELRVRPTTEVIFSMGFLARCAQESGCERCAGSIVEAHIFLEKLKKSIDDLPSTI